MDINPELQKVIDQVTKYATTPIGGAMGQTAAQGRALLGVGEIAKDLQQTSMQQAGAMEQQKVTEAGTMKRLGITEAGAKKRTEISTAPAVAQEKRLALETPGSGSLLDDVLKKFRTGGVGESDPHGTWDAVEGIPSVRKILFDEKTNTLSNY